MPSVLSSLKKRAENEKGDDLPRIDRDQIAALDDAALVDARGPLGYVGVRLAGLARSCNLVNYCVTASSRATGPLVKPTGVAAPSATRPITICVCQPIRSSNSACGPG